MGFLDATGITTLVTKLKDYFALKTELNGKQDTLVSGVSIKTLGGSSLLGSGDISFPANNYTILKWSNITKLALNGSGLYRVWFTSADGTKMVPINTSTSISTSTVKTLNTTPINPFLPIIYYANSASAGSSLSSNSAYISYTFDIRYSYIITLTNRSPVFVKCLPQSDGSVVLNDIVQTLPTASDGYVYIFLGTAYSSNGVELSIEHPVFYYDGTRLRIWTGESISS